MHLVQPLDVYHNSEADWYRLKDGVRLPLTTSEAVSRLCRGRPWAGWGGVRLSHDHTHYVLPSGRPLLQSTVRRQIGTNDTPHKLLSTYLAIPNGQVKNFLNACRAAASLQGLARVAILGSKAAEGGGIWHKYFALWLAHRCTHVIVDFYDPNERPVEDHFMMGDTFVSCEWIQDKATPESIRALGYNCVVDDVWTYEQGSGLVWDDWAPAHFSFKGTNIETQNYEPFLHPTETRYFSHFPLNVVTQGCCCPVCVVCKACSCDYEDYLLLRLFCSRLGHDYPCLGVSFQNDLAVVSKLVRDLMSLPQVPIKSMVMLRALTSVSEEVGVRVQGEFARQGGNPHFQPFRRFDPKTVSANIPEYQWIRGKTVLFVGVPSTILGKTDVKTILGLQSPQSVDVTFYSGIEAMKMQIVSKVVYLPVQPALMLQSFPDWEATGRQISYFREYVQFESPKEVMLDFKRPSQRRYDSGKKLYVYLPPLRLFPYLDTTLLIKPLVDRPMKGKPAGFCTIDRAGGNHQGWFKLVPYKPERWRHSIAFNETGWCKVIDVMSDGPGDREFVYHDCVYADVTSDELLLMTKNRYPLLDYKDVRALVGQTYNNKLGKRRLCKDLTVRLYLRESKDLVVSDGVIQFSLMIHPLVKGDPFEVGEWVQYCRNRLLWQDSQPTYVKMTKLFVETVVRNRLQPRKE